MINESQEMAKTMEARNAGIDPEDYDEDAITPADVLSQMTEAWQAEVSAPVLLPHKYELVDCMIDQIGGMQENLRNDKHKNSLKHGVHKMELYRIGFIVNDYIRERLKKIEANPSKWLAEHDLRINGSVRKDELLDTREKVFAERFLESTATLMGSCFLNELPPGLSKLPVPENYAVSDRVIIEVKSDYSGNISVPDMSDPLSELLVNLEPNSTHLIPYKSIANLVETNNVSLL